MSPSNQDEAPLPHAGLNLEVDRIEELQAIIVSNGGSMTELREATRTVPDRVATFGTPKAMDSSFVNMLGTLRDAESLMRPRAQRRVHGG